jgi:ATP-dependent Lon protease
VFAVAQRDEGDDVDPDKLYAMGTIAKLGAVQRGANGTMRVVLEGVERAVAVRVSKAEGYLVASLGPVEEQDPRDPRDATFMALHREVRERAAELGEARGLPEDVVATLLGQFASPGKLADFVAGYL